MLLLMNNHQPLLSKSAGAWVLGLLLSIASLSHAQEKGELFTGDLRILTAVIPHYKVDGVSTKDALEKVISLALGDKAEEDGIAILLATDRENQSSITLELSDVSAQQIIEYLAELSGNHWKITGPLGAPSIQFNPILGCDLSDRWQQSIAFRCSKKVAFSLGINAEMTPQQTAAVFSKYGVELGEESAVYWSAKNEMMGVRNLQSQNTIIQALVTFMENGWSLVKTDQTESLNKK